jgi:type II secretory pathway pseudopilin PulG
MKVTARLSCQRGFTYLAALMMVIIMGIMLGVAGQSWKTVMQREREEELLFRGLQIKAALTRWHKPSARPGMTQPRTKLNSLEDLLEDPRTAGKVRHLRRLYKDPMTGEDFVPIMDGTWGIIGVRSASEEKPIKQAGFPPGLEALEGKERYRDWEFRY